MMKLAYTLVGAVSLLAMPALAQGSNSNSAQTKPMSQANLTQMQQKITSDLQQDGYKNVRVVPNSFLVHATDKRGEAVVMIINPDSVFAITEPTPTASNAGSPNSAHSGQQGLGANPSSTTK